MADDANAPLDLDNIVGVPPPPSPPPFYAGANIYHPYQPDVNVPTEPKEGVLDVSLEGYGYLRPHFIPSEGDIYISASQIRRFDLRPGDWVGGQARSPKDKERYFGLLKVETVNGVAVDKVSNRPHFGDLTPVYPDQLIKLETGKTPLSTRLIDLVSPIGRGQRGLLVSPPKAGKTFLLKDIAHGIAQNSPDLHLMAVLVGERPEEVTDLTRSVKGEVVASNFDELPEHQTRVAEIAIDRAKRLVEMGQHVVILLDSITRLARAYNLSIPSSGRTLTGGFDPAALYPPKKFFGAARNIEKGGSLTIIGTCLIDTGSKMDDLVYEEFKGTGNMELHLSRSLAERRIFPAIDIQRSGTRQEQLLYAKTDYPKIATMRKMIDILSPEERSEVFLDRLLKAASNAEFLKNLGKG
jgi:transcription termination factor Rho